MQMDLPNFGELRANLVRDYVQGVTELKYQARKLEVCTVHSAVLNEISRDDEIRIHYPSGLVQSCRGNRSLLHRVPAQE